jgi:hypothetical protein
VAADVVPRGDAEDPSKVPEVADHGMDPNEEAEASDHGLEPNEDGPVPEGGVFDIAVCVLLLMNERRKGELRARV